MGVPAVARGEMAQDGRPRPRDDFPVTEVMKCVQVALLCVQDSADDRPNMSNVVAMLGSEGLTLPEPRQPAYFSVRISSFAVSTSSFNESQWRNLELYRPGANLVAHLRRAPSLSPSRAAASSSSPPRAVAPSLSPPPGERRNPSQSPPRTALSQPPRRYHLAPQPRRRRLSVATPSPSAPRMLGWRRQWAGRGVFRRETQGSRLLLP